MTDTSSIVNTEARAATLFQLAALASAVEHGSIDAAAANLGIRDKFRVRRAIERLADNLSIVGLADRLADEPTLLADLRELAESASKILASVNEFAQLAAIHGSSTFVLRVRAFPTAIAVFLADAAAAFEADVERRVAFPDADPKDRLEGAASIFRPVLSGAADVVVGPVATRRTADLVSADLYSWRMVACFNEDHPLRDHIVERDGRPTIPMSAVQEYRLLVSPAGHATRNRIEAYAPSEGFKIEMESTNSLSRIVRASRGDRVALIASDAVTDRDFESRWPVLTVGDDAEYVEGHHAIHWRKDRSRSVLDQIDAFVAAARAASVKLNDRIGVNSPIP